MNAIRAGQLIDSKGIASLFNISRPRVWQIKQTLGFPRPVMLEPTYYRYNEIIEWGKETGRLARDNDAPQMLSKPFGVAMYEGLSERYGHMIHTWVDGSTKILLAYGLSGRTRDSRVCGDADITIFVGFDIGMDNNPQLRAVDKGNPLAYKITWEQASARLGRQIPYWEAMSSPDMTRLVHQSYAPNGGETVVVDDAGVRVNSALWQMALETAEGSSGFARQVLTTAKNENSRKPPVRANTPFAELVVTWRCTGELAEEKDGVEAERAAAAIRMLNGRVDPVSIAVADEIIKREFEFGRGLISHDSFESVSAATHLISGTKPILVSALTSVLGKYVKAGNAVNFTQDENSGCIYAITTGGAQVLVPAGGWSDFNVSELHFYDRTVIAVRRDGTCFYAGDRPLGYDNGARVGVAVAKLAADGYFDPSVIPPWLSSNDVRLLALEIRMLEHTGDRTFIVSLDELR
jgi:predicted DNA-binding transcriptional regulator AlpA